MQMGYIYTSDYNSVMLPPKPVVKASAGLSTTVLAIIIAAAALVVIIMLVVILCCCGCCGSSEDPNVVAVKPLPADSVELVEDNTKVKVGDSEAAKRALDEEATDPNA